MPVQWVEHITTSFVPIEPNPLYPTDAATYREYHEFMWGMEKDLTAMHDAVNTVFDARNQLEDLLAKLNKENAHLPLRNEIKVVIQKMKAWDEDMVQRKSKAYDDVENFPNKFSANYMFLINQTESDIPRVN